MENEYENEQLMVCHESAQALYRIGAIGSARMREFDEMCLVHDSKIKLDTVHERKPALAEA
jgi:DNA-binding transcriptional regulator YiaG